MAINLRKQLLKARHKIFELEGLLAESERAVSIYSRAADIAHRDAEEQRRRRLDLEQEMNFAGVPQSPAKPARPRKRKRRRWLKTR